MPTTHIELSSDEATLLRKLAEKSGKSEQVILKEAIQRLLSEEPSEDWRERIKRARGIWKDRTDIPPLDELRKEWDRSDKWDVNG